MCFPCPGSNPRPGGRCPAEFPSISFPRLGFLSVYGYFGLNSPDSSPLPAPPAQMLFLQASPGHFCPLCPWETRGVLARLAGGAGGPWGLSVARASWAQHVLWAQATWGLSQLSVGAQLPWKNTGLLLSRKGLAGPGQEERAHRARRPGPGQWLRGAPRGLPTPASCPLVCCLEVRLRLKTSCCRGPVKTSSPLFSLLSLPWVLKAKQRTQLLWEAVRRFFTEQDKRPGDPAVPLLGTCPREQKVRTQTEPACVCPEQGYSQEPKAGSKPNVCQCRADK